jgi:hypothetical protein
LLKQTEWDARQRLPVESATDSKQTTKPVSLFCNMLRKLDHPLTAQTVETFCAAREKRNCSRNLTPRAPQLY